MRRFAAIIVSLCTLPATGAPDAVIELRGAAPAISVERASIEPGGLRVTRTGGVTSVVAWDMVRTISGVEDSKDVPAVLELADDLWRARSRVQRGDVIAARPLFEKHFDRFRGTTSETALVVAEGLLRCRLASEDWLQAIVPAIETARLRRAGVVTDRYAGLVPVIDDATFLSPQLAPDWAPDDRTKSVADQVATLAIADVAVARIASLYAHLLRGTPPDDDVRKDDSAAAAFLHAMARLRSGDDAVRARAAKELATSVKTLPEWARAWANHTIGRVALGSPDRAAQIDGVLALMRVAAQPSAPARLVRHSLDLAIPALRSLGDPEGAAALERERSRLGGSKSSAPILNPILKPVPKPPETSAPKDPVRTL